MKLKEYYNEKIAKSNDAWVPYTRAVLKIISMVSLVVWFFKSASYDAETHKTFGEMADRINQIEKTKQFSEEYGYLMFNVGIRGMLIVSLVLMFCYILITAFVDRNYPIIIGIVLGSLSLQFVPTNVGAGGIAILVIAVAIALNYIIKLYENTKWEIDEQIRINVEHDLFATYEPCLDIEVTLNNGETVQISELAKANIEGIVLQEVLNKYRQGDQQ